MFRENRQRASEQHRAQGLLLPNAAVVYAVGQHVEETFNYLRSDDRLSLHSDNVMVALASVGQLLGLAEYDIERLLNMAQKEPSLMLAGMSYSEFVDAVRCLAVLHGHLALEALPALQVPDLSKALYNTYMSYSQALRPHPSGAVCRCRQVAGEPPPRLFWESFLRLCRDAGIVQPEGPLPLPSLERIWLQSSSSCDKQLPHHMCFAQFLRSLAVVSGQIKSEVFVPVAAVGMSQEVPELQPVPNTYRLKHYKEVPLNLGGTWSLPHLTFEALAKAVQEGRRYEYAQFLRDAQETALRDEAQRQQLKELYGSGGGGGLARRSGGGGGGGGGAAGSGGNGRLRPWSAGLTVLSPHPRRAGPRAGAGGAAAAVRLSADDWAGISGRSPAGTSSGAGFGTGPSGYASAASGDGSSSLSPPSSRPTAPALSGWTSDEPPSSPHWHRTQHLHHQQQQQQQHYSHRALSNDPRTLERSRSAAAAAVAAAPPPAVPGVEGGGRVFLDSARPRALHTSTSFSPNTSPRTSLVLAHGAIPVPGPGTVPVGVLDGGGSRPTLSRLLSRRNFRSPDGICSACGAAAACGSDRGSGSGAIMSSSRPGGGGGGGSWINGADATAAMAIEYCAAGVRELRRDVEGRLGAMEEQGRQVESLLERLQEQLAALREQQQQLEQQQMQEQERRAAALAAAAAREAASNKWKTSLGVIQVSQAPSENPEQQAMATAIEAPPAAAVLGGGGGGGGGAASRPPRPRSPPRPSSAREDGAGRDTARYGVVVRTSDQPGAGTDADVLLTIYGARGDTGERLLTNGSCNFDRGRVSTFVFTAADVGEVHSLRLRMRTQGPSSGGAGGGGGGSGPTSASTSTVSSPSWHLESVQVASSSTGTRYRFPHRGWVDNVLGRECILHCKGTAPDVDGDPPGWQPAPRRVPGILGAASAGGGGGSGIPHLQQQLQTQAQSPPHSPPQQLQLPQQQEQQQQQAFGEEQRGCSPMLTPRNGIMEIVRPSPPSPQPSLGLPSLTLDDAVASPVAPPGFVRGVTHNNDMAAATAAGDGATERAGAAAGDTGGEDGSSLSPAEAQQAQAPGSAMLEERIAELQRRVQQVEEAQADTAARAATAIAAAVLVRMPAPLLAAVRYGGGKGEAHHGGAGGSGGGDGPSAAGNPDDSALALLADLLTHVHSLAEQGVTAAAAAETQAAAAADAGRRQQSRLSQLQFELNATSQAAEQAASRSAQISKQLEAVLEQQQLQQLQLMQQPKAAAGADAGALAEAVRVCNTQLAALATMVKQATLEQGAAAAAALSQAEALTAETQSYQARLAASLADITTSLAAQRRAREGTPPASPRQTGAGAGRGTDGDGEGSSIESALAAFRTELLQLARAVGGREGGALDAGVGPGADGSHGVQPHPSTETQGSGVAGGVGQPRGAVSTPASVNLSPHSTGGFSSFDEGLPSLGTFAAGFAAEASAIGLITTK
ncbi:Lipoxygenase y domain-containing protein 1 [Pleodorina starrii]|uniref:Lipoxygenase y domain-containing protein 1 n=1 Tax=Pleodorina starrii TaxID=330485 RepID=A0A9W6BFU7_9CHLO|nr:Lipoxygenase y domain-containing protein 1 [Pleodorina starrii]GLC51349.1 Lipoxygenase y domain-containing protein 1 [Pleodorina starrii]GLC63714.1 Lipoxygenase y domain-containing protein 1 [Pleodorina starrii]